MQLISSPAPLGSSAPITTCSAECKYLISSLLMWRFVQSASSSLARSFSPGESGFVWLEHNMVGRNDTKLLLKVTKGERNTIKCSSGWWRNSSGSVIKNPNFWVGFPAIRALESNHRTWPLGIQKQPPQQPKKRTQRGCRSQWMV